MSPHTQYDWTKDQQLRQMTHSRIATRTRRPFLNNSSQTLAGHGRWNAAQWSMNTSHTIGDLRFSPCSRYGAKATWRFQDDAKSLVEVTCPECGVFELPRADFDCASPRSLSRKGECSAPPICQAGTAPEVSRIASNDLLNTVPRTGLGSIQSRSIQAPLPGTPVPCEDSVFPSVP